MKVQPRQKHRGRKWSLGWEGSDSKQVWGLLGADGSALHPHGCVVPSGCFNCTLAGAFPYVNCISGLNTVSVQSKKEACFLLSFLFLFLYFEFPDSCLVSCTAFMMMMIYKHIIHKAQLYSRKAIV